MKILFTVCIVFGILASCGNRQKRGIDLKNNLAYVEGNDQQMSAAIKMARETFIQFDSAFKNGHFDTSKFFIKVRFETPDGGEHIWTHYLKHENGSYYGTVDEDAVANDSVKEGERVKIEPSNLSDWMYSVNGVLRGGFTIRVVRNKLGEKERASFDSSFGLKIID